MLLKIAVICAVAVAIRGNSETECLAGWEKRVTSGEDDYCYKYFGGTSEKENFDKAKSKCVDQKAELWAPKSKTDIRKVKELLTSSFKESYVKLEWDADDRNWEGGSASDDLDAPQPVDSCFYVDASGKIMRSECSVDRQFVCKIDKDSQDTCAIKFGANWKKDGKYCYKYFGENDKKNVIEAQTACKHNDNHNSVLWVPESNTEVTTITDLFTGPNVVVEPYVNINWDVVSGKWKRKGATGTELGLSFAGPTHCFWFDARNGNEKISTSYKCDIKERPYVCKKKADEKTTTTTTTTEGPKTATTPANATAPTSLSPGLPSPSLWSLVSMIALALLAFTNIL